MEARNRIFQELKPICVKLNAAALQFAQGKANRQDLSDALSQLVKTLQKLRDSTKSLDAKLAEYAFFPLSHIFKETKSLSAETLDLALQALDLLFQTGWRTEAPPDVGKQLLTLLSFLADRTESAAQLPALSEDVQTLAYRCLSGLFASLGGQDDGRDVLTDMEQVPKIGHCVFIMIQGALQTSPEVQVAALTALNSFCAAVRGQGVLRTFAPGIITALNKLLTPSTKMRRPFKAIQIALEVFAVTLVDVFGDRPSLKNEATPKEWLQEASSQIKVALINTSRLRQHQRLEVIEALAQLYTTLLTCCVQSLPNCRVLALETLISLAASGRSSNVTEEVQLLASSNDAVPELLQESLRAWLVSLPRITLGQDDTARTRLIQQISFTYSMLVSQGTASLTMLDRTLVSNLQASVINLIRDQPRAANIEFRNQEAGTADMSIAIPREISSEFETVWLGGVNHKQTLAELDNFMSKLKEFKISPRITQDIVDSIQESDSDARLANLWLALHMLHDTPSDAREMSTFFNVGPADSSLEDTLANDLYSSSLQIISTTATDGPTNANLTCLALEAIALYARRTRTDFRLELIDSLYHIVHLAGSPSDQIRKHAFTCLNVIAECCEYKDAQQLLLENVDYLINSVGIKLNTFDISPQAPLVLAMMVRLSGPALVPYVDDLVESIFAALENFHGYPNLVELLFFALKAIAVEGSRDAQLLLQGNESDMVASAPSQSQPTTHTSLVATVKRLKEMHDEAAVNLFPGGRVPQAARKPRDVASEEDEEDGAVATEEDPVPPAKKTFDLIVKICRLTQHFLPSASPRLRASLLSILKTTLPAISKHENTFLPLINTLWPMVTARLSDTEAYVSAGALDVIASMCVHAGSFMTGRIEGAWDDIRKLHETRTGRRHWATAKASSKSLMLHSAKTGSGLKAGAEASASLNVVASTYVSTPERMIWESLVGLLLAIVRHVDVGEDYFQQILRILSPLMGSRPDVRQALESRNADAVWLQLLRKGEVEPPSSAKRLLSDNKRWGFRQVVL